MVKGLINKILPFSSVDGPGNRTVIFLQGCNFNCLYCHNPETINSSNGYDSTSEPVWMSVGEVLEEIKKARNFISGITISGGECTLQDEFIVALSEEVRKFNLTVFIDSNGSIPFYENERLINVIDMVMLDVKTFDRDEHIMLTGQNNEIVIKNMDYLASIGKLYEVRTVIVPGVLDNERNVDKVSKRLVTLNPEIIYKLIKYRSMGVRPDMIQSHSPSNKLMEQLSDIAKLNGCKNVVTV